MRIGDLMTGSKLLFLKNAFPEYTVNFSEDCTDAIIINPNCGENISVYYEEEDEFSPFCVSFSFQHRHLCNEKDVVEWIGDIINGKLFAIEFFKDGKNRFGSEIEAKKLNDLSYATLEHLFSFATLTELLERSDSFKVRGWNSSGNFDAEFILESDGSVIIKKS